MMMMTWKAADQLMVQYICCTQDYPPTEGENKANTTATYVHVYT